MTANLCVVCGRPTPDGYACVAETEQARQQLAEIAERVAPARDVAHRQTAGDGTGGSGTPGSRVPIDLGAGARLDAVQVALTGWARELAEARSVGVAPDGRDVIVLAAAYIAQCLEIARHKRWIDEMLREIADCLAAMRTVTAPRRERIYLGTCGAERKCEDLCSDYVCFESDFTHQCQCWCHRGEADTCEGSVYGSLGASRATCRVCGARYDQEARIAERAKLAGQYHYTGPEIVDAFPGITAVSIRVWRHRGLLEAHGKTSDGQPLYDVTEVLAVAASRDQRQRQAGKRRAIVRTV
jgi:hypothetical protein